METGTKETPVIHTETKTITYESAEVQWCFFLFTCKAFPLKALCNILSTWGQQSQAVSKRQVERQRFMHRISPYSHTACMGMQSMSYFSILVKDLWMFTPFLRNHSSCPKDFTVSAWTYQAMLGRVIWKPFARANAQDNDEYERMWIVISHMFPNASRHLYGFFQSELWPKRRVM